MAQKPPADIGQLWREGGEVHHRLPFTPSAVHIHLVAVAGQRVEGRTDEWFNQELERHIGRQPSTGWSQIQPIHPAGGASR